MTRTQTAVALGDSLTTNPGSTSNYPYYLGGLRGPGQAVLNAGVGGNTTTQMLARVGTDVTPQHAAYTLVLGMINDIIGGSTAAAIEANLAAIYSQVPNPVGLLMYGFGNNVNYTAGRDAVRQAVNAWIVGSGVPYVDLNPVMNTPGSSPQTLAAAFDSGDGLHPNAAGALAMAQAVFATAFASRVVPAA